MAVPLGRGQQALNYACVSLPVLGASMIAASRLIDYHHHFADVVGGSVLGKAWLRVASQLLIYQNVGAGWMVGVF